MGLNVISLLVENKPGVLFNISNTIRRKNFNIHSITAIAGEEGDTSRITLTSMGDAKEVDKLVEQLDKMVDIISVKPKFYAMRRRQLRLRSGRLHRSHRTPPRP